ncbi:MAG: MFS transporter, partial [Alphaproteobacteria bacterium]|nr:MFS transporter [Alphaproteobacteria bacterium]
VTVPLSLGAVLCTALFVSERRRMRAPNFDWTGFGFLVVGVAALLTMLSRGERHQWFDSTEIVVEGAVAAASFYGFALRLAWARVPFVSAALFRDFNFVLGNVFSFLFGTIMYLAVFLIPIQLQTVAGYDIIGVGDLLGFRGVGVVLGALVTSFFAMRTEPRVILIIAIFMGVVSSYAMSTWTADVRAFDVAWTIAVSGASSSVCYIPLTVLTFATLPERYRAEGMGFFYVTSLLGTSIGTAVIFNVLTRSARVNHDIMVERLNPFNELLSHGMTARAWTQEARDSLAALDAEMLRQATQIAYNNCFLLIAIVAAVLVPLCFLMRMPKGAR